MNPVAFASATVRFASTRMSISGCSTRSSTGIHTASATTATTSKPTVRPELHPQCRPSLNARRNATRISESNAAPGTSRRVGVLMDDSGTSAITATTAAATRTAATTNSQRHER